MRKKIVITGGLGYIGTELCKIYSGYSWHDKITIIDNRFISERVNQLRNWNMNFVHGDILDKDLIEIPETIRNSIEIVSVKTVEEVLKHALTKELKPVKWVEIDQVSNKNKEKSEVTSAH